MLFQAERERERKRERESKEEKERERENPDPPHTYPSCPTPSQIGSQDTVRKRGHLPASKPLQIP